MYDLILKNGLVIDGTGGAAYKADVAVENGLIAAVAPEIDPGLSKETVDVTGFCVTPGFIDIHSHSDSCYLVDDRGEAKLYQGVTSELCGQCGGSEFAALVNYKEKMGTNLLPLAGHGTMRAELIGYEDRLLLPNELTKFCDKLDEYMKEGAWGLSLGLGYTPGISANCDELCKLGDVVAPYGGIITSHMRNQRAKTPESLEEMFEINRKSGAHVHIAHFKANNFDSKGRAGEWAQIVHDAQNAGINVTADVYPYTAANSDITNSFPKWSIKGGKQRAMDAISGSERSRLLSDLEAAFPDEEAGNSLLIVYTCGAHPEADGKTLEEISKMWSISRAEALSKLAYDTKTMADCITFCMDDADVECMLSQNDFSIGSDGCCYSFNPALNNGRPHPRSFGTFPRFLRLCRERNICSPEVAVRRITGQSADYIGIIDRGYIKSGLVADLAVIDMAHVTDTATYVDPFRKPVGIKHVIISGRFAIKDYVQTDERLGRVILR